MRVAREAGEPSSRRASASNPRRTSSSRALRKGMPTAARNRRAVRSLQRKLKDRPDGAMSARAVAQVIKRTAKRAALPKGVQERISPHWLRHAHASRALDNRRRSLWFNRPSDTVR